MFFVLCIYLMLAAPLSGSVVASLSGRQGGALVCLRIAGINLIRYTGLFEDGSDEAAGAARILKLLKEHGKSDRQSRKKRIRNIETLLLRCARIDRLDLSSRVGMGDAWRTALTAGSIHAAFFSALGVLSLSNRALVCVVPDFDGLRFCVHLRCMFSVTAGDVMLSAIHSILRKDKKEEKRLCSSIRLKI